MVTSYQSKLIVNSISFAFCASMQIWSKYRTVIKVEEKVGSCLAG